MKYLIGYTYGVAQWMMGLWKYGPPIFVLFHILRICYAELIDLKIYFDSKSSSINRQLFWNQSVQHNIYVICEIRQNWWAIFLKSHHPLHRVLHNWRNKFSKYCSSIPFNFRPVVDILIVEVASPALGGSRAWPTLRF